MPRGRPGKKGAGRLAEYRAKRRFDVTPEPEGDRRERPPGRRPLRFVVHKHRARQLHYDLRLEWKGVLLSWAVPKGPSLDPSVKRLAMQTEDHPGDYDSFEGVIPAGEYGGGTMMIWDRGVWLPEDPDVDRALSRGELKLTLLGEKLRGSFVLVRTRWGAAEGRRGGDGAGRGWLLIKHDDAAATTEEVTETRPRSVASGRLLAEIAFEEGGDPVSAASGDPESAVRALLARLAAGDAGAKGSSAKAARAKPARRRADAAKQARAKSGHATPGVKAPRVRPARAKAPAKREAPALGRKPPTRARSGAAGPHARGRR